MKNTRDYFWIKTEFQQLITLILLLTPFYTPETDTFFLYYNFPICEIGFSVLYGISLYKLHLAMKHVREDSQPIHGNYFRQYNRDVHNAAIAWLGTYCDLYGEHQPDLVIRESMPNEDPLLPPAVQISSLIFLPPGTTSRDLFECFRQDMALSRPGLIDESCYQSFSKV